MTVDHVLPISLDDQYGLGAENVGTDMWQCLNCEGSGYFDLPDDSEVVCSVCGGEPEQPWAKKYEEIKHDAVIMADALAYVSAQLNILGLGLLSDMSNDNKVVFASRIVGEILRRIE